MNILEDKFNILMSEYQNSQQTNVDIDGSIKLNKTTFSQFSQDSVDSGKLVQYTNIDKRYVNEYIQTIDDEQFTQIVTKEEFDDLNITVRRMQKLMGDFETHIYFLEKTIFELEKKVKELEWPVNDEDK